MKKCSIAILWIALTVVKADAASLGTYRIYLDNKNPQDKFIVKNRSTFPEQCEVSFSYRLYKENGQVVKLTEAEQAERSKTTLNRIRYSPRKFIIQPKSFQYVTFNYRRQINDKTAEHRSYANFTCSTIEDEQQKVGISFTPNIIHSVPLVIRTATLNKFDVNLSFVNIKQQGSSVSFKALHAGNRSFYGDIYLVTANGTELKTFQRNVVIYPDMIYKEFAFDLGEFHDTNTKIVFQENNQYGGTKSFELPMKGAK